jgi:pyruvate,orthophosphate dikinase
VPRGALTAGEIAKEADFFSFGTNDLTQLTYGFSRDDIGKFLGAYQDRRILERDPFASLDTAGVGQLVAMGTERGRATKATLKVGVCGEHGGDPSSIHFFDKVGLNRELFAVPGAGRATGRGRRRCGRVRLARARSKGRGKGQNI